MPQYIKESSGLGEILEFHLRAAAQKLRAAVRIAPGEASGSLQMIEALSQT